MERIEEVNIEPDIPVERLRSTLDDAPVRVAILFGSRATGETHARSDFDIAIAFAGLEPGDPGYNETFFGLSASVSEVLATDDVDLVDVHSLSPSFARSVFDDGVLLVGTAEHVETLRASLGGGDISERPAVERFDDALRRIDEHLA
ncbi:type VII toxin-antitoxin system MntA family adenylyltransferase antitoxin [Halosimplex amylolyticum]|uniref:type VII toxin-antitoxin system MntA family adenylyltransferase antitoxin n=1 Tax=Halosimplex amylolyticum TaxID=3396616 RepID=UPI003F56B98B